MSLSRGYGSKHWWMTLLLLLLAALLSAAAAPPSEPQTRPGRVETAAKPAPRANPREPWKRRRRPGRVETAAKPDPRANPREPWKWTLDERLALRFDPEDMRRRADED